MASATTDRRMGLTGDKGMKAPVDCATTANITLSGEQTIDGVTTSASRVLVKNQTDTTKNGVYDSSSAAWTRAIDCNGNQDLVNGTLFYVSGGAQAGAFWHVSSTNPITIGTSAITFALSLTAAAVSTFAATLLLAASAAAARSTLAAAATGTLDASGIVGTATNDSAAAGEIGEHISSVVTFANRLIAVVNGTPTHMTSISLTAGDWDVQGVTLFLSSAGTTTGLLSSIGTTSATINASDTQTGWNSGAIGTVAYQAVQTPIARFSLATTTTIYLTTRADFTTGTVDSWGSIRARRVR